MDLKERITEICKKADLPLQLMVTKGSQAKVGPELELIKKDLLQCLELIPISFLYSSNHSENTEEAISYAQDIEKNRRIIELCITILDELKNDVPIMKLRSLLFAWEHREEVV